MIQMILRGRGGQGIVFLTRLLGGIAILNGLNVISSETHGIVTRGGSINSHLKIGPLAFPLIRWGHADCLISWDSSETLNNKHFLQKDGIVFENSSGPSELSLYRINAAGIELSIARLQLENVVLLGFSASSTNLEISLGDIKRRLEPESRGRTLQQNRPL